MRFGNSRIWVLVLTAVLMTAGDSMAQGAGATRPPIELSATYGTMWGGNIGVTGGKLRNGTGGSMGFALDVPVSPGMWLEASYTRQDGSLDWDATGQPVQTLTDMSVNFWQLGSVRAIGRPGAAVTPIVIGSLGATYFSPANDSITIGSETYALDGITKFSITFGAGFKAYFGEAQKVGIRATFKVLSTLYDSGGGVYFGTGGAGLGISGSGIWQYEAAGGLTVKFGG